MKKQKTQKTNKGITLIALVITIIVMLILVAVTISMAVNGGLFEYARNAGTRTNEAIDKEQILANGKLEIDGKWYNNIEDYINNKPLVILPEGIKVGDYVNYTPTVGIYKVAGGNGGTGYGTSEEYQEFETETGDNALQWRILSINEETGEIKLVAATVAQISKQLYFKNRFKIDILNDLCERLYSKETEDGKRIATAKSIKVEDINAKTTFVPENHINRYSNTYTYQPESSIYLNTNLGINTSPIGLIILGNDYWLADEVWDVWDDTMPRGLRYVSASGDVSYHYISSNYAGNPTQGCPVRPIINFESYFVLTPAAKKINATATWDIQF